MGRDECEDGRGRVGDIHFYRCVIVLRSSRLCHTNATFQPRSFPLPHHRRPELVPVPAQREQGSISTSKLPLVRARASSATARHFTFVPATSTSYPLFSQVGLPSSFLFRTLSCFSHLSFCSLPTVEVLCYIWTCISWTTEPPKLQYGL